MNKDNRKPSDSSSRRSGSGNTERIYKNGYKPINEGYKPITSEQGSDAPKAPKGGSGKSD